MDMRHSSTPEERALFRRLVDEQLTPEEFQQLEKRLLADEELRARYLQFADLEANLYAEFESDLAGLTRQPARRSVAAAGRGRGYFMAATAALVVGVAALAATLRLQLAPAPEEESGGGRVFVAAAVWPPSEVAVVTHVGEDVPPQEALRLLPGLRLRPGTLRLSGGEVEIEFFSGTQVVLQGPAELQIVSSDAANLLSGKAAARVLKWGKGFALNTPDAAFVDLGTEFALSVDRNRGSELNVVDGEVEVSLLDDQGSTRISERARKQAALLVTPGAERIERNGAPSANLPSVRERPIPPLPVTPDYVAAVQQSQPLIYWRFETDPGSLRIPNEAGSQWSAELRSEGESGAGMQVENGMLRFRHTSTARWLASSEGVPNLNAEAFSVEMWVNPDMLHWATLLGVVPEGERVPVNHLNVIELAHMTSLLHQPGAFRFLHRHPPNRDGGLNLFTHNGCTPGQWHYLAAVKTPQEIRFYLNGDLVRRHEGPMGEDAVTYQLMLGQLRTEGDYRQFAGAIDEFAVYQRALTQQEVSRHYELLARHLRR